MTLAEKKDELTTLLSGIKNSQERFASVIELGKRHPALAPELKTEVHRVQGCLAKLWFVADFRNGNCFFQSDGDSVIVKAIAAILCDFYSGHPPAEVLSIDPTFLAEVGITQHLTSNRRNALTRIWELIRNFAEKRLEAP